MIDEHECARGQRLPEAEVPFPLRGVDRHDDLGVVHVLEIRFVDAGSGRFV